MTNCGEGGEACLQQNGLDDIVADELKVGLSLRQEVGQRGDGTL